MTWTVFGYYGGPLHNDRGFLYQDWFTVDDYGTLVAAKFILSSS